MRRFCCAVALSSGLHIGVLVVFLVIPGSQEFSFVLSESAPEPVPAPISLLRIKPQGGARTPAPSSFVLDSAPPVHSSLDSAPPVHSSLDSALPVRSLPSPATPVRSSPVTKTSAPAHVPSPAPPIAEGRGRLPSPGVADAGNHAEVLTGALVNADELVRVDAQIDAQADTLADTADVAGSWANAKVPEQAVVLDEVSHQVAGVQGESRAVGVQGESQVASGQGESRATGGRGASLAVSDSATVPGSGGAAEVRSGAVIVPVARHAPAPDYPSSARRRGQEGAVLLVVRVGLQGEPEAVTIEKSSGFPLLDSAAEMAVGRWRFEPGCVDGRPEVMTVEVPFAFRLND